MECDWLEVLANGENMEVFADVPHRFLPEKEQSRLKQQLWMKDRFRSLERSRKDGF